MRCVFHTAVTESPNQSGEVSPGDFMNVVFLFTGDNNKSNNNNDKKKKVEWQKVVSLHAMATFLCEALQTTLYDRHSHFVFLININILTVSPTFQQLMCVICVGETGTQRFHRRQISLNTS